MKRYAVIAILCFVMALGASAAFADGAAEPTFQTLEKAETIVYGEPQGGGLLTRLNNTEKDVFGRELPGSLTERQSAMLNFLEKGSGSQPSLLFKLAVAEWAVASEIYPESSLTKRVESLESIFEGSVQNGALAARVERLITRLLPDGVAVTEINLPAATVIKTKLTKDLSVKTVKAGDEVVLKLIDALVLDGSLIAPKGSRVFAKVSKVKPPRSFGRPSEIAIEFSTLEALGPLRLPVTMGESAKKAMQVDSGTIGAVGASVGGAVLLGPLGLAGGFLVRGSDKPLKEGTLFYVENSEAINVQAYKVPPHLSNLLAQPEASAQPAKSEETAKPDQKDAPK